MFVSRLEIKGFRGVRDGRVNFQPFTTLFGPNNCGKTTITEALALVLGRDRLVRPLTEHDFFGSTPAEADRISIIASITGFEPNDPGLHPDWFRYGRGTSKWLDADDGDIKPEATKSGDRLVCQIAFAARFDHESLETVTARYFYDGQADPFDEEAPVVTVPVDLIRQIGFFLVPASRTWDRTISFGSELFRRVVSYVGGRPAAAVLAERTRLRVPANPLERDDNLQELVGEINADIKALFGTPNELKLRLTSTDSDGILEAIVPHFGLGEEVPLPARRHGSGLVSLQTLILLMRFGRLRIAAGDGFMMVIEEPEIHVPPPLQRKLLRMLQSMATQTIVTTHSPTVAAVPDVNEIALVVNEHGSLTNRQLNPKPLAADAANPIRSLLLSDRDATVYALMHRTVLVPEGKLDASWLRLFVKILEITNDDTNEGALRFAHEIGVVPTKDARAAEVFSHLKKIHPRVVCLFDGDQAGTDYTNTCCRLRDPPTIIIRWPPTWTIEHVAHWIVSADPTVLRDQDVAAAGFPADLGAFLTALSTRLKADEIAHSLLANAIASSPACRRRAAHILSTLSTIASEQPVRAEHAEMQQNGQTAIWTFNHAVQGI